MRRVDELIEYLLSHPNCSLDDIHRDMFRHAEKRTIYFHFRALFKIYPRRFTLVKTYGGRNPGHGNHNPRWLYTLVPFNSEKIKIEMAGHRFRTRGKTSSLRINRRACIRLCNGINIYKHNAISAVMLNQDRI